MALFDFAALKRTIHDAGGQLKKLREERETLMRQREDLESAPLNKSDFREVLENWVDRQAAGFVERLEAAANFYLKNPMAVLPENAKAAAHPMAILTACRSPNDMATLGGLEANLFYVLAPQIKQGLSRAIGEMDFSEAGPPRAERVQMIEAIDAKIIELDRQEAELLEAAEQAGVRL